MSLNNNKSWLFSIFAFVTFFAGSSFLFIGDSVAQDDQVPFSTLSDADFEMILAVKEEMREARDQ
ncbi:MAG: hypothetical protein COA54_12210 [Thiotrichaceae bacterium]|nr:MAG: hypothetical protein COA54_12210 [Thiotrichaceae bacterium]